MVSRIRLSALLYNIPVILLLGGLYTGINTRIGLHYTVACLQYFLPGHLEIQGLQGRLLGPIKADTIEYKDAQYLVKLKHFTIHWKKRALFKGQFFIQLLQIKDLIVIAKPIQSNASPSVPRLLKRIRLYKAQLTSCLIKVDHLEFQGQGILGVHSQFHWTLRGKHPLMPFYKDDTLQLKGILKGHCLEDPQFELEGASKKSLIWIAPFLQGSMNDCKIKLPPFQVKSQLTGSKWTTELKFINQNKTQASITFALLSPQRLLQGLPELKQSVQCDLNLQIQDWSILKNIAPLSENLLLTDITGPLKVQCHLVGTKDTFEQWIKHPQQYVLQHCQQDTVAKIEASKKQLLPQLSLLWQKPVVPNFGIALHEYGMTARLQGNQITWQSYAVAPPKYLQKQEVNVGKWELTGNTQCFLDSLSQDVAWWKHLNFKHDFALKGTAIPWFTNTHYTFWAAPNLDIQANHKQASIRGTMDIPKAKFQFQYTDANQTLDKDVQFSDHPPTVSQLFPLAVAVGINIGKAVYFEYEGAKARLEGALQLSKTCDAQSLSAKGAIRFAEGYYSAGDQKLLISPQSKFIFKNSWRTPQMDIIASQMVRVHPRKNLLLKLPIHTLKLPLETSHLPSNAGFEKPIQAQFGLHLGGNTENPELKLFVSPPEWISQPREDITNMLTGQPIDRLSMASVPILLNAAAQLSIGYTGYRDILSGLNKSLGLQFEVKADEAFDQTHLSISKNLAPGLSIGGQLGLKQPNAKFKYLFNENIMIEANASSFLRGGGLDVVYQKEYN